MQAAVRGLERRHCVLRHRVRGVGRHAQDRDAVLCRRLLVDVVEAGAAQEDQADAAVVQLLDDVARSLVVDEDADGVIAIGEMRRLARQTAREILELDVVRALALVLCKLAEIEAVVVLRAEKRDLENGNLLLLRPHRLKNRLNLLRGLLLVGAVHRDIDLRALRGMKVQDLQHVVALGRLMIRLERHCRPQIAACLCDLRRGARMNTE